MQLVYYRAPVSNFGDDLNAFLWDRAAPGLIDDDGRAVLLGIGTLLGRWFTDRLPTTAAKIVLGAGAGAKGALPTLDERWHVYGVRGPLTAAYLGLGSDQVLTDPAMLLADLWTTPRPATAGGIGFMPHIWSIDAWDWRATCARLRLTYLDPLADPQVTLATIAGLDRIVTEAMHGAIVADALRVPWHAVSISPRFEATKWADWAASVAVDVHIRALPHLRAADRISRRRRARIFGEGMLDTLGVRLARYATPASSAWEVYEAERILTSIVTDTRPQLSAERPLRSAIDRTWRALERLQRDYRTGGFAGP